MGFFLVILSVVAQAKKNFFFKESKISIFPLIHNTVTECTNAQNFIS